MFNITKSTINYFNLCQRKTINKFCNRQISSAIVSCEVNDFLVNRNPRNLERLRIARKPTGFHLDKPGKTFWHKVVLERSTRFLTAKIYHSNGNCVIQASTKEWGINRHLYRTNDLNSYTNLAKVLANRCLESGIYYMINGIDTNSLKKTEFIKNLEAEGVTLCEPQTYKSLTPWSLKIDEKPWKVFINF